MSLNWSPQGVKLIFHPKWWSSWRFGSWKYLRHTYASIQIDLNAIPKYIQNQMGRALIKLTLNTYCHLTKDINREAATRFGEAIFEENGIRKGQRITGCPVTRWNHWRRQPDSNRWITVLQTAALADLAMPPWHVFWSGKRDSNPRQSRWQREALPAELFPP